MECGWSIKDRLENLENPRESSRSFKNRQKTTRILERIRKILKNPQESWRESSRIFKNIQESSRILKNLQESSKIHKNLGKNP